MRDVTRDTSAQPDGATSALVLIAEDEAPIAEVLAMIVEEAGYVPLVAVHGRQALELARARHPALLITDLMMPQLSGAELIAALRADADADADGRAIPVILTTAAPMPSDRRVVVDAYLRKPFNITEVEALLHQFLASEPRDEDVAGPHGQHDIGVEADTADTADSQEAPGGHRQR